MAIPFGAMIRAMKNANKIQGQAVPPLATELRRSVVRLARRLRDKHPPGSLTPARLSVLRWLQQQGAMTAGQIAAADSLQPQSVTRLLSSLQQDGLIMRLADDTDRRRVVVRITPAGVKILRADAAHRDEWLAAAIDATLDEAERAILVQASTLLDRLASESGA